MSYILSRKLSALLCLLPTDDQANSCYCFLALFLSLGLRGASFHNMQFIIELRSLSWSRAPSVYLFWQFRSSFDVILGLIVLLPTASKLFQFFIQLLLVHVTPVRVTLCKNWTPILVVFKRLNSNTGVVHTHTLPHSYLSEIVSLTVSFIG